MTSRPTCDPNKPSAPTPAPTILLVENDSGNRTAVETLLLVKQFGCVACATFDAGWTALKTHTISVIVVDLGVRALELIARVRATPTLAHIPIIVVTGMRDEQKHQEALQAGAAACLLKPVANALMLAEINRCLDHELA